MSTRSLVGRIISEKPITFTARYCHSDGYPAGVGQTIIDNWRDNFDGSSKKVVEFLLSTTHGWSGLDCTDFTKQPAWTKETTGNTPRWYDDRPGIPPGKPYSENSDLSQIKYAYLFDTEENLLHIYKVIASGNLRLLAKVTYHADIENIEHHEE